MVRKNIKGLSSNKIAVGALVLLFMACNVPKADDQFDKERIDQEVRLMFDNYHKAVAEGGLMAEFEYLDQSDDFFWVPPGYNSALSYDSVRRILEKSSGAVKSLNLHWDTLQVFPLSKDIANYSGIVIGETIDTADQVFPVAIIESGTVIKRGAEWKLLSGQSANLKLQIESPEVK